MKHKNQEFISLLNKLSQEINEMTYSLKTYKTIQEKIDKKLLNSHIHFFSTIMTSLLDSFIISFWKVFEKPKKYKKKSLFSIKIMQFVITFWKSIKNKSSQKDNLSIYFILDYIEQNIDIFSKESLQNRKKNFPDYANDAFELNIKNIEDIKKDLRKLSYIEKKIKNMRHMTIAHNSIENIFTPKNANITFTEAFKIIYFIKKVDILIFQSYHNGKRFDLKDDVKFKNYFSNSGERKFTDEYDYPTIKLLKNLEIKKH